MREAARASPASPATRGPIPSHSSAMYSQALAPAGEGALTDPAAALDDRV